MKTIYVLLVGLLFSLPVLADVTSTDAVLHTLEKSGIQFVYATPAEKLTILRTKATSNDVDELVKSGVLDSLAVDIEIVTLAETLEKDSRDASNF